MARPRPAAGSGTPTITTIADEVGVSVATVSKVLNGRSDVAADTRALVEACLERHQYRRRPRRQPAGARQIDLVFHEFNSAWSMEIIQGVASVADTAHIDLVLSQLGGRHGPSAKWLEAVIDRRPRGLLLVHSSLSEQQQQQLRRQLIPFVVVDTDSDPPASVPTVGSNNWTGGLLATRHLLDLGHRRIAMISGPEAVLCSRARLAGFRSAHEEAGVEVDPGLIRYGNFYLDAGYAHGLELLSRPDRPTAVFAGSDLQAMGVLRAAHQLDLRVPADLSVVGYDNLPVPAWLGTALTTVDQPLRDMAAAATRMLLDLAAGVTLPTSRIELMTQLIVRESTAAPARGR